jgi:5-(carboxyamino)imidazole ribonucleotide synthase
MHYLNSQTKLGILGGGQLGKMLLQKAADFNITSYVLDPDEDAPCKHLCTKFFHGSFNDYNAVMAFGSECDIITIEIEHVNTDALFDLEKSGKKIFPQPSIIKMVQDKGLQKEFYDQHNFPTSSFYLIEKSSEIKHDKFPLIQKTRKAGYDGKGVKKINSPDDLSNAFNEPSVIEDCVEIEKEISVIVARNASGEIKSFPAVEMEFNAEANLVEFLFSPCSCSESVLAEANYLVQKLIAQLNMVGVLAVEMFVTKNNTVLINEIAPRPHNSGHHTIEGNVTSQYEQLLRAIFNLPLGDTAITQPSGMVNLLGEKDFTGDAIYKGMDDVLQLPGAYIHLYGKKITKPFRKMGHVTVTGKNTAEVREKAARVKELIKVMA